VAALCFWPCPLVTRSACGLAPPPRGGACRSACGLGDAGQRTPRRTPSPPYLGEYACRRPGPPRRGGANISIIGRSRPRLHMHLVSASSLREAIFFVDWPFVAPKRIRERWDTARGPTRETCNSSSFRLQSPGRFKIAGFESGWEATFAAMQPAAPGASLRVSPRDDPTTPCRSAARRARALSSPPPAAASSGPGVARFGVAGWAGAAVPAPTGSARRGLGGRGGGGAVEQPGEGVRGLKQELVAAPPRRAAGPLRRPAPVRADSLPREQRVPFQCETSLAATNGLPSRSGAGSATPPAQPPKYVAKDDGGLGASSTRADPVLVLTGPAAVPKARSTHLRTVGRRAQAEGGCAPRARTAGKVQTPPARAHAAAKRSAAAGMGKSSGGVKVGRGRNRGATRAGPTAGCLVRNSAGVAEKGRE
jgi:hypothetical protein